VIDLKRKWSLSSRGGECVGEGRWGEVRRGEGGGVVEGRQALSDRLGPDPFSSLPVRWRLSVLRLPPCSQHSINGR